MATIEEMKSEALKRMKYLRMSPMCRKAFENGKVWFSEGIGALYDLSEEPSVLEKIRDVESDGKHLVYHIVHNYTDMGELWSMLCVTSYDEDWESEWDGIKDGYVYSYVFNADDDYMCSEFGDIVVAPSIGGLVRLW